MTWQVIRASSIGTSHIESGEICQDECFADVSLAPDGEEYFLGLVSDGAGSASHGGRGAGIVCESGINIIEQGINEIGSLSGLTRGIITNWILSIRQNIFLSSEAKGVAPRDFACTLLGAIVGAKAAAFFQIGDGAIVIRDGSEFNPVFWPDAGEYVNMTHFITDEDALAHIHIEVSLPPPDEVAMFSDGLQRLALIYNSRAVHKPFFEPMFDTLRKADITNCDTLSDQLAVFLSSPKVNERTDDDKTLVLATRKVGYQGANRT